MFDFLEDKCKIYIPMADTELLVPFKQDKCVQRLQVNPGWEIPVILMKQLHYDEQNREVLHSLDYFQK